MKKLLILLALLIATPAQASLYDYYQGQGLKLPSIAERRVIALAKGFKVYSGTKEQNILLEQILRGEQPDVTIQPEGFLGAGGPEGNSSYNPVTGYQSNTTQYISAAATTIPVASTLDKNGVPIALGAISASTTVKVYMNLEPGTQKEEPIVCTGVTATSWTGCTRGLPFQGGSETTSSTVAVAHNAGAVITITNIGQFYNQFISVDGAQTINNVKTFTSLPFSTTSTPTDDRQLITLFQLNRATTTGGVFGTTTVAGNYQAATDAQLQAGTVYGSTGAVLVATGQSANQTSTANKIPVANGQGKIDSGYLPTSSTITWSGQQNFASTTQVTSTITTATITSSTIAQLNLPGINVNNSLVRLFYTSTTANSLGNSTATTTLVTTTIRGGALGTGNIAKLIIHFTDIGLTNGTILRVNVRYGATTVFDTSVGNSSGANFGFLKGDHVFTLQGAGATNSQFLTTETFFASSTIATLTPQSLRQYASTTFSVDSTIDQSFVVSVAQSNGSAVDRWAIDRAYGEYIQ